MRGVKFFLDPKGPQQLFSLVKKAKHMKITVRDVTNSQTVQLFIVYVI
jgi:hypothetical protein